MLDDDVIRSEDETTTEADRPEGASPRGRRYGPLEWRGSLGPGVVLVALVLLTFAAWWGLSDTEDQLRPLDDIDTSGSFDLSGTYVEELVAYGPYAHAVNLTLSRGDRVVLEFTSTGPPEGVQVRLQDRLHPSEYAGGARVFASSVGERGTIDLRIEEEGAFQVYFWHPGAARPPGPDDDQDAHLTATVSYVLRVERAIA